MPHLATWFLEMIETVLDARVFGNSLALTETSTMTGCGYILFPLNISAICCHASPQVGYFAGQTQVELTRQHVREEPLQGYGEAVTARFAITSLSTMWISWYFPPNAARIINATRSVVDGVVGDITPVHIVMETSEKEQKGEGT